MRPFVVEPLSEATQWWQFCTGCVTSCSVGPYPCLCLCAHFVELIGIFLMRIRATCTKTQKTGVTIHARITLCVTPSFNKMRTQPTGGLCRWWGPSSRMDEWCSKPVDRPLYGIWPLNIALLNIVHWRSISFSNSLPWEVSCIFHRVH